MPAYVGLLRAVNLGAGSQVSMERLRTLLSQKGLSGVVTLLQSGNVVFRSPERDRARLEEQLEGWVKGGFGLATACFVRSEAEWRGIVSGNPFPREASEAPNHLVVLVLKGEPPPPAWESLSAAIRGRERVQGSGRHAYIVYPDGIGRSRLTNALLEKHLGTPSTARNWNTVRKLEALVSSRGGTGPLPP
jgi:uncharacterized protein (DUF1697 family)